MDWEVKGVKEVRCQLAKRGMMESFLKGDRTSSWLIDYLNYHVTVRHKNESFDRIFVLEEQEAKSILFEK